MRLTWIDRDEPDPALVAGAVSLLTAAGQVDRPSYVAPTVRSWLGELQHGWDGDPADVAAAVDGHGWVVGLLTADLPRWDNLNLASLRVLVDPHHRRQGLGSRLLAEGVAHARAAGRTVLWVDVPDDDAGRGFLAAHSLTAAYREVVRRQHLREVDREAIDRAAEAAAAEATGYQLLRVPSPVPADLLDDVVRLTAAINDAPVDDLAFEPEVYSPERVLAFDEARRAEGQRVYRLVARSRVSGELAGHTVVTVDGDRPWYATQADTSVLAEHRGHRLGLTLKVGMMRWLDEAEPQVRILDTWNAASNDHMIAVNETLGYQVLGAMLTGQRELEPADPRARLR